MRILIPHVKLGIYSKSSAPHFLIQSYKIIWSSKKNKKLPYLKSGFFLIDSVNDIMILMIDTDDKNYWFKQ